jgi:hypothetical protein
VDGKVLGECWKMGTRKPGCPRIPKFVNVDRRPRAGGPGFSPFPRFRTTSVANLRRNVKQGAEAVEAAKRHAAVYIVRRA